MNEMMSDSEQIWAWIEASAKLGKKTWIVCIRLMGGQTLYGRIRRLKLGRGLKRFVVTGVSWDNTRGKEFMTLQLQDIMMFSLA